jgi:hypothetical protein
VIRPPVLFDISQQTSSSEAEKTGREMSVNFAYNYLFHTVGMFIRLRTLRYGEDGFTSPKESVVRIFIALKRSIASVGFEPANLGSNCKHDNYYTTEGDRE